MCRILDWFHVPMKFQAEERPVLGCTQIDAEERSAFEHRIRGANWLVWHGKSRKGVARLKALDEELLRRPGYEFDTLWWNINGVMCYVRDNPGLVNYARRHHKGLPVSSSIDESAVNQVVSLRMAKKRQMRWSDEGAHLLAQVRANDLNGELRPRDVPIPTTQASTRPSVGRLPHAPGSRVAPALARSPLRLRLLLWSEY
jgi:hypothetical protein